MNRLLVAGAVVMAVTVLVAGAWTPGYDLRSDTVSRLASPGQPYAAAVRMAIVVDGLLIVAAARRIGAQRGLVVLSGVATVVAGIAPKDPPHVDATMASRLHVGAAVCSQAALIAAMWMVARRGRHAGERRASALAGTVAIAAAVIFPFTWGSMIYGLLERLLLLVPATWLIAITRPARAPALVGGVA
jgi:hypothetical membrane protein